MKHVIVLEVRAEVKLICCKSFQCTKYIKRFDVAYKVWFTNLSQRKFLFLFDLLLLNQHQPVHSRDFPSLLPLGLGLFVIFVSCPLQSATPRADLSGECCWCSCAAATCSVWSVSPSQMLSCFCAVLVWVVHLVRFRLPVVTVGARSGDSPVCPWVCTPPVLLFEGVGFSKRPRSCCDRSHRLCSPVC